MQEANLIEHLQKIGLTDYEIKIYTNLITIDKATASEIAQISGVPRTKAYEVLANLCFKGLCVEIPDNVRKYSAVDPVIAINSLRSKAEEDFTSRIGIIEAIQNQLEEIYENRQTDDESTSMIQVYRDKNTIWQKVQDLLASAEKEISVFSKEPYIVSVSHTQNSMKQISKNVRIRSIYEEKDVLRPDYAKGIAEFKKEGEEVRISKQLPVKMTIIDDKLVLLILKDKSNVQSGLMAIIINQSDLAKTFKVIFNFFWKQGKDLIHYQKED